MVFWAREFAHTPRQTYPIKPSCRRLASDCVVSRRAGLAWKPALELASPASRFVQKARAQAQPRLRPGGHRRPGSSLEAAQHTAECLRTGAEGAMRLSLTFVSPPRSSFRLAV
ncbi:hypothetical protein GN956_G13758 [Arapaima gigas]